MTDGWIRNDGRRPVNKETLVIVRLRIVERDDALRKTPSPAGGWRWTLDDQPGDIVEWRRP